MTRRLPGTVTVAQQDAVIVAAVGIAVPTLKRVRNPDSVA
jgi:hypothetical protein